MTETINNWLTVPVAAEHLATTYAQGAKTAEQWTTWLQNNRNQSRQVPYRIPFERLEGLVVYHQDELDKFVEWDKQRQLGSRTLSPRAAEALRAFGVGEAGGGSQGRRFTGGSANLQSSTADGAPFVRMTINDPLMVFAMTPDQAIAFGRELVQAGETGLRMKGDRPPKKPVMKVLADNKDARIVRMSWPKDEGDKE